MYFVVKKRTDGRDSEKPQYVTFTYNKDVPKILQSSQSTHIQTSIKTASAYMWSKKVRTFPDYFANYEQLHRYRLEAAQA